MFDHVWLFNSNFSMVNIRAWQMSQLLGISFKSPVTKYRRWNIPKNWVMWNIGTFPKSSIYRWIFPSSHPFEWWIFPYKPFILGYPHGHGTPPAAWTSSNDRCPSMAPVKSTRALLGQRPTVLLPPSNYVEPSEQVGMAGLSPEVSWGYFSIRRCPKI